MKAPPQHPLLAVFLVSSNTYFFAIGKVDEAFLELTGHLSLFAVALLLIVHGSGSRLRVYSPFVEEAGEPVALRTFPRALAK